jgi:hypothetical protein
MLDADPLAEGGVEEGGDIAGGVDIRGAGDEERVDDDSVVDGKPGPLGQLDIRLQPDPGDDAVDLDCLGMGAILAPAVDLPIGPGRSPAAPTGRPRPSPDSSR